MSMGCTRCLEAGPERINAFGRIIRFESATNDVFSIFSTTLHVDDEVVVLLLISENILEHNLLLLLLWVLSYYYSFFVT